MKNLRKFAAADERVINCERALNEALTRHDRELGEEQVSRLVYLLVWMRRHGSPLLIPQDELREAHAEMQRGARLEFGVGEDGETLRIGVVGGEGVAEIGRKLSEAIDSETEKVKKVHGIPKA